MSWLFPDERKFFEHFSGIAAPADRRRHAAGAGAGRAGPAAGASSRSIDRVQRETDEAAHDLDVNVDKLFVPPMDREDIHLLSTQLSLVADFIGGTARRAVSLRATTRREPAVAMARIIVRAVARDRGGRRPHSHRRRGAGPVPGDQAGRRGRRRGLGGGGGGVVRRSPDPVDVIRWKTLYDQLEDTLDACEDVANELETITVKHT